MNADTIKRALSIASKVALEIIEGLRHKESNAQIRARLASRDLILDDELDELRAAQDDLADYVRTGR